MPCRLMCMLAAGKNANVAGITPKMSEQRQNMQLSVPVVPIILTGRAKQGITFNLNLDFKGRLKTDFQTAFKII